MTTSKTFHLGDVLSITTGRLLAPGGIGGVYKILDHMTGDSLFTHQLPRVSRECTPFLLQQFPELGAESGDDITPENHKEWLAAAVGRHGEWFAVEPLPANAHEFIDPISELAEHVHPDRIIVAKL